MEAPSTSPVEGPGHEVAKRSPQTKPNTLPQTAGKVRRASEKQDMAVAASARFSGKFALGVAAASFVGLYFGIVAASHGGLVFFAEFPAAFGAVLIGGLAFLAAAPILAAGTVAVLLARDILKPMYACAAATIKFGILSLRAQGMKGEEKAEYQKAIKEQWVRECKQSVYDLAWRLEVLLGAVVKNPESDSLLAKCKQSITEFLDEIETIPEGDIKGFSCEYHGGLDQDSDPHGNGKMIQRDGTILEGQFEHGKLVKGTITYKNGTVDEIDEAKKQGVRTLADGTKITGAISSGFLDKITKIEYKKEIDGKEFIETFTTTDPKFKLIQNKPHGEGEMVFANGTKYKGDFNNGVLHGKGTMTYPDGKEYDGDFYQGLPDGNGLMKYADGKVFSGRFVKGEPKGEGMLGGQRIYAATLPNRNPLSPNNIGTFDIELRPPGYPHHDEAARQANEIARQKAAAYAGRALKAQNLSNAVQLAGLIC